jgi:hypothetical protein
MPQDFDTQLLSHVPLNHVIPPPFGLEDGFDDFTGNATAAREPRDVRCCGADLHGCVTDRDAEPDVTDDGQVGQIIADVTAL